MESASSVVAVSKKCFKCGEVKPLDAFYAHSEMADGHLNKCKECTKKDVRLRLIMNPEKVHAYDRRRSKNPERAMASQKHSKEWNKKYPEKYRAHYLLTNAVRDGRVIKPIACEMCGYIGTVHGHHADYSKPLEVVWLCATCHGQIQ